MSGFFMVWFHSFMFVPGSRDDEHRDIGLADDTLAGAAEDGAFQPSRSVVAYHDEVGLYLACKFKDRGRNVFFGRFHVPGGGNAARLQFHDDIAHPGALVLEDSLMKLGLGRGRERVGLAGEELGVGWVGVNNMEFRAGGGGEAPGDFEDVVDFFIEVDGYGDGSDGYGHNR